MPDEARLIVALALAAATTFALVPAVIQLAERAAFYDVPLGYKRHSRPTPYLGGLAIMAGFALLAISLGEGAGEYAPIVVCGIVLCAIGTLDDRINLGPLVRVSVEAVAAVALWATGLGWEVLGSDAANLLITVAWVVGVVNAFNLMDNLDGAAATVGGAAAVGAGALAQVEGETALAVLGFALAGACFGFLPSNLSRPARIFMGDGGSMPLGLIVAAIVMGARVDGGAGSVLVLAALPIVGLPVLDMALVIVSRRRRRVHVLSGARDHTTHRLLSRLGSARAVAAVMGVAQAGLCVTGIAILQLEEAQMLAAAGILLLAGVGAVAALEAPVRARAQRQES